MKKNNHNIEQKSGGFKMITCEDGKKIFRIGFEKAIVSLVTTVILTLLGGIGLGFRIAYTDHFTLKQNVESVSAMQSEVNKKLDSNKYNEDQNKLVTQLDRMEGKIDTVSQNLFIHINGSAK